MVSPLLIGSIAAGKSGFDLYGMFNKSARKLKKRQYQYEKAQAAAQLADINAQRTALGEEHPYQRALQTQSMFARGLGKSSIYQQDRSRLLNAQARQIAALRRSEDIAARGLSLIKRRRRYERRMVPMQIFGSLLGSIGYAAGAGAFGGSGGSEGDIHG